MKTKRQDFLSWYLNPIMANNYGQNVLGSTYNNVEFLYSAPKFQRGQFTLPFGATTNINPVTLDIPYLRQRNDKIRQINNSLLSNNQRKKTKSTHSCDNIIIPVSNPDITNENESNKKNNINSKNQNNNSEKDDYGMNSLQNYWNSIDENLKKKLDPYIIMKYSGFKNNFNYDDIYLSNISLDYYNLYKNYFLWDILPEIIAFLKHIHSIVPPTHLIIFVARDCYFLEKLYRKLFPESKNFCYLYCSRKLMYHSTHFKTYLENVIRGYDDVLWIDVQGSGSSHLHFYRNETKMPRKLFLKRNHLVWKDKRNEFITEFLPENWKINPGNTYDGLNYAYFLESILLAPYNTIIDMDEFFNPIFSKHADFESTNRDKLVKEYNIITEDIFIDKINLRSRPYYFTQNKEANSSQWNGLLIFDIDGTISHKNNNETKNIITFCQENKIKISLCSARQNIFYDAHHESRLKDIIEIYFHPTLDYDLDVWFNPYQHLFTDQEIALKKLEQIEYAAFELKLPNEKVFIFDDNKLNTETFYINGFQNTYHVCSANGINFYQTNELKHNFNILK
jgi:hypothetical protein